MYAMDKYDDTRIVTKLETATAAEPQPTISTWAVTKRFPIIIRGGGQYNDTDNVFLIMYFCHTNTMLFKLFKAVTTLNERAGHELYFSRHVLLLFIRITNMYCANVNECILTRRRSNRAQGGGKLMDRPSGQRVLAACVSDAQSSRDSNGEGAATHTAA